MHQQRYHVSVSLLYMICSANRMSLFSCPLVCWVTGTTVGSRVESIIKQVNGVLMPARKSAQATSLSRSVKFEVASSLGPEKPASSARFSSLSVPPWSRNLDCLLRPFAMSLSAMLELSPDLNRPLLPDDMPCVMVRYHCKMVRLNRGCSAVLEATMRAMPLWIMLTM